MFINSLYKLLTYFKDKLVKYLDTRKPYPLSHFSFQPICPFHSGQKFFLNRRQVFHLRA